MYEKGVLEVLYICLKRGQEEDAEKIPYLEVHIERANGLTGANGITALAEHRKTMT
jgi:hypothetical protein